MGLTKDQPSESLLEVPCLEIVSTRGRLEGLVIGYAICLSGKWDGWSRVTSEGPGNGVMRRVANASTREAATKAVLEYWFTPIAGRDAEDGPPPKPSDP